MRTHGLILSNAIGTLLVLAVASAAAQQGPGVPPAVGVVPVTSRPIARSNEYVGRIQATNRVNVVARVAAYLDERLFIDGAEVRSGELLYRLEQAPFEADVQAKEASVAQFKAQLRNADIALSRAQSLLQTHAGPQSTVDAALANDEALKAEVLGAEALLQQSRINLGYTEIRASIDGKIGRTIVTTGNYVGPSTGVLASIVSQDPMYVVFPVSTRNLIELRRRDDDGANAVIIKIRLPDGRLYAQTGKLDFLDNTVAGNTDTIIMRGIVPNPLLPNQRLQRDAQQVAGGTEDLVAESSSALAAESRRELIDGELVTVLLEDAQPITALTVPRAAILTDQGGDYVYVVGPDRKVQQRRVELGKSLIRTVVVTSGLSEGESVITEGLQRARPGQAVSPRPASKPAGSAEEDETSGQDVYAPQRG